MTKIILRNYCMSSFCMVVLKSYRKYKIEIVTIIASLIATFIFLAILPYSHTAQKWLVGKTKLSAMQSIFQLGAATSIAFAVAGPQIQHALGPRVKGTIQNAKIAMRDPNVPLQALENLVQALRDYEIYKRELVGYTKGNLYGLHLYVALFDILLLFWSSVIDPIGKIPNFPAILLCVLCIIFPMIDLFDASREALHMKPILKRAKDACDTGVANEIQTASKDIRAEIKPFPTNI